MPVDPFLEPRLVNLSLLPEQIDDFDAFRAQNRQQTDAVTAQLAEPGPQVKRRRDVSIPVVGGTIDACVYHPFGDGPHAAHIYLHGGGWVMGSIQDPYIDIVCRERCVGARCVVVSVDYRKAPEHKFPIGLVDCYAALSWVHKHAGYLGIRREVVTVGGASAGGNLAAALALKVRDESGPALAFQLLEVPALDLSLGLPSHEKYGTGYPLALSDVKILRRLYLNALDEATHPYVSPLLAPDLVGLPSAHVMSAEYDMLRDDGEEYVRRLRQAGVPATFSLQQGHVHSSATFTKVMAAARAWRHETLAVLLCAHEQAGHTPSSDLVGVTV